MNKKLVFLASTMLFANLQIMAETKCFIAAENTKIIEQEGDAAVRHSPCSSFKIPLSLMGYNENILIDEDHPEWPFEKGYTDSVELWKQPHNPKLWMKHSCVWFSQVLTKKLGLKKFKNYVQKFDYGNKDISGDKGKNNGLTRSWLSSSLQISPQEQMDFLSKLLNDELPVSKKSHEMTKNILFIEELSDGWKFYGKTGCGDLLDKQGKPIKNNHLGWFVGWAEKDDRIIKVVHYCEDEEAEYLGGKRAREEAKARLVKIIN